MLSNSSFNLFIYYSTIDDLIKKIKLDLWILEQQKI